MAFGLFGTKENPIQKLVSGKNKTDQEKQQLLAAIAQANPPAEELVPLMFLDEPQLVIRALALFIPKVTPTAIQALIAEGLAVGALPSVSRVLQKCREDMVLRVVEPMLAPPPTEETRRLWELAVDLPAGVSEQLLERAVTEAPGPQRVIALKRLVKGRGAATLKPLLLQAAENREAGVRREAVSALATLEGDDIFKVMLDRLGADEGKEVRDIASQWLQRFITRAPPEVRPQVLGKLLLAGTPEQRSSLVKGMLSQSKPAELLLGVLTYCKSLTGEQHRTVMEALKSVGDPLLQPAVSLLSHADGDLRVQAVYLLEAYADPRTLGPLLQMLNDSDWWVRIVVCETIGRIKEPKTLAALQRMFQDTDAKWAAIDAVASVGGEGALSALFPLLQDKEAEVRGTTVLALARLKDPRVEAALNKVANEDASIDVRLKAVEALRALKGGTTQSTKAVVTSKDLTKPMERLLAYARESGASDLHVTPGEPPLIRLNGKLQRMESQKVDGEASKRLLTELVDPVRQPILEKTGAVDFCYPIAGVGRYRANVFKMKRGYAGVFRCIPTLPPTLAELNVPRRLFDIGTFHQGIVLVTGPAGCGKTTTLTALVNILNDTRRAHVLTFEDPIEFVHQPKLALINQREIGKDSLTYASAMRGALREDPDIIVVGDMRDPETIRLALLASETGHLVIATMQTTGAAATIDKLVESFPTDEQVQVRVSLSESLKLVVSQILVPRADGLGRVGVFEVLTSTSSVRSLIRDGKSLQLTSAMVIGRAAGMQTLDIGLEERMRSGDITLETALQFTQNRESFLKHSGSVAEARGTRPSSPTAPVPVVKAAPAPPPRGPPSVSVAPVGSAPAPRGPPSVRAAPVGSAPTPSAKPPAAPPPARTTAPGAAQPARAPAGPTAPGTTPRKP